MTDWRYELHLFVLPISRTRQLRSLVKDIVTFEDKIRIFARSCNILYIFNKYTLAVFTRPFRFCGQQFVFQADIKHSVIASCFIINLIKHSCLFFEQYVTLQVYVVYFHQTLLFINLYIQKPVLRSRGILNILSNNSLSNNFVKQQFYINSLLFSYYLLFFVTFHFDEFHLQANKYDTKFSIDKVQFSCQCFVLFLDVLNNKFNGVCKLKCWCFLLLFLS